MDGAFFRRDVLALLEAQRAEYAIKVPFYAWTGLKALVQAQRHWTRVNATVSCFERQLWLHALAAHAARGDLPHARRSTRRARTSSSICSIPPTGTTSTPPVVTNKALSGRYLWRFMCGRGGHEKAYGELKSGFAFASVPSLQYAANSAWQQLSVLAFNLMRSFQVAAGLTQRPLAARRRPLFAFRSVHTLRYELLHRAGLVLHPAGKATLDVGTAAAVRHRFLAIDTRLPRAA